MAKKWIGVDLDGTLAVNIKGQDAMEVGDPIMPMLRRVKQWLKDGEDVRIFTARVAPHTLAYNGFALEDVVSKIEKWCRTFVGKVLPITCIKDLLMKEMWDDRAVAVRHNDGTRVTGEDDPPELPTRS